MTVCFRSMSDHFLKETMEKCDELKKVVHVRMYNHSIKMQSFILNRENLWKCKENCSYLQCWMQISNFFHTSYIWFYLLLAGLWRILTFQQTLASKVANLSLADLILVNQNQVNWFWLETWCSVTKGESNWVIWLLHSG